jgi:hypothetical protein
MFDGATFIGPGARVISILVGIAVLTLGRKLFWLFVGAVGFVIGLNLATQFLKAQPDWVILVVALVVGLVGAVLAILVQKIAVTIAGFVMGGYAIIWLLHLFSLNLGQLEWLIGIVGGIIGAILAASLFEAALIVLSSIAGATLIIQATNFNALIAVVLFIVLMTIGIVVQAQMWQQRSSS